MSYTLTAGVKVKVREVSGVSVFTSTEFEKQMVPENEPNVITFG